MMRFRRKCFLIIFLLTLLLLLWIFFYDPVIDVTDRNDIRLKINNCILSDSFSKTCKMPKLPVYSDELMKFDKKVKPIDCSSDGIPWVACVNSKCKILEQAKKIYGVIVCSFTDIIRVNDNEVKDGKTTKTSSIYYLIESDVVKVSCTAKKFNKVWREILVGIRQRETILNNVTRGWKFVNSNSMEMNVLILVFDSLSRNSFIRKLPKSYEYLTKNLSAHVLKSYNIVGDGTVQAVLPILTGKTELELPEVRKRIKQANYVDVYPLIWNNFKENGYVTGYFEDSTYYGTFNYRLKGFKKEPTDHYMRSYYTARGKKHYDNVLCAGPTPMHQVFFNQVENFYTVYKDQPKFLFAFHSGLSHNTFNMIGAADEDLLKLLQNMKNDRHLNKTILIVMSDHGHRFSYIRNTIQGKFEERLPFFSFVFPDWFHNRYPTYYKNFVENIETLTTPFDIYSTLKTIIDPNVTIRNSLKYRSISLFSKIPNDRSCVHAYIEPHWCACLEWKNLSVDHPITKLVSEALIKFINMYTIQKRKLCAELELSKVYWIQELKPNDYLLRFKSNADKDGYVANFFKKTEVKTSTYQIKVKLVPGEFLFEATIVRDLINDSFSTKASDISRTNQYGNYSDCIEENLQDLRKYCYCLIEF